MKKIIYGSLLFLLAHNMQSKQVKTKTPATKKAAVCYRQDPEFSNLYYKREMTLQEAREEKNNCLLGIDMNGVLFDKNKKAIPAIMQMIVKKKGFIYAGKLLFASRTLNSERTIINKEGKKIKLCWDAVLSKHENPNDPLQPYVEDMRMATTKVNKLNIDMAHLLYMLHEHGHHNYVFSNMGCNVLATLTNNLEKNQPSLDELSQDQFSYLIKFLKERSHSFISSQKNNWITKPDPATYKSFLNKNKNHKNGRIFIDDKRENVIAALENGFDFAIVYKNPKDLERILFEILHLKR